MQIRQGDVFLEKVKRLPKNLRRHADKNGRLTLAGGETTGHHHSVLAESASLYVDATNGGLYLKCGEKTELVHQEHLAITLSAGIYRITRQREYSPEEIRAVAD